MFDTANPKTDYIQGHPSSYSNLGKLSKHYSREEVRNKNPNVKTREILYQVFTKQSSCFNIFCWKSPIIIHDTI